MNYRLKLLVFVVCMLAVFFLLNTGYSALNTLSRLDQVEAERDRWQQPDEVVKALNLKAGDVAVDLGCGSGYFSLKLSRLVGKNGHVIAEDIRRLSLTFLWVRTILKAAHNITVLHGETSDPHLPVQRVNEVLISNTFHELTDPQAILMHVRESLVSGGGLVVIDRSPKHDDVGPSSLAEHEISVEQVESELRQAGFEIIERRDDFVETDPENESWWLVEARKP